MADAKKAGKAIVYIGFGSITVPNPNAVTQTLVKAVLKSKSCKLIDVRNKALDDRRWCSCNHLERLVCADEQEE